MGIKTGHIPQDPQFEDRIRKDFARQNFLITVGASLRTIQPGEVGISAPFNAQWTQQDGFLHAGVVSALTDTACGYAAYTLMPSDCRVMSVEFKINNLSPAMGEYFLAHGRVIKSGRTLTICEGNFFAIQGEEKRHVAVMQATMICLS